jgi:unsaturated rhamnogalacturonyl hydrolase
MFRINISIIGFFLLSSLIHSISVNAQEKTKTIEKLQLVAHSVLLDATFQFVDQNSGKSYPSTAGVPADVQVRPESQYTDWRYWNGVLNIAMVKLAGVLQEPKYSEFVKKNIAFSFENFRFFEQRYKGEGKWNYPFGQRFIMEELDDCGAMGASVIEVYQYDRQERYRNYIDQAAEHMLHHQSRLADGTFVRSFPHPWTLWADDLYMSLSFLSRMGELTHDNKYFADAVRQVIQFHHFLFNHQSKLMHHCWYSDVNRQGVAFWGRANGWAMLAQIELLDRLPKNYPQRDSLLHLLQRHILGISQYQGGNGLWHQLLDKEDSYEETSCSAMFVYAIARAVNAEYIESRYASIAQRGWEGIMSKIHEDGKIEGICTGTGVSDNLVFYYQRPAPLNDVHGIGAVLLAGAEVLLMQ